MRSYRRTSYKSSTMTSQTLLVVVTLPHASLLESLLLSPAGHMRLRVLHSVPVAVHAVAVSLVVALENKIVVKK